MDDGQLTAELESPAPRWTRQRLVALGVAVLFVGAVSGIAVAASDGGGGKLPKLPVGSSGAIPGPASARPALAPYGVVKYEVQGTLPALAGSAPAYRLPSAVPAGAASRLAGALGLHGSFSPSGDQTQLTDGQKTLMISNGPGSAWFLSGALVAVGSGGGVANASTASPPSGPRTTMLTVPPATACPMPACPPNALCAQLCGPPTTVPRPDLPSSAAATDIATKAAAAAGFDVSAADVTVTNGSFVTVELAPRLGGLRTSGWSWTFDIGSKGVIEDARGFLAQPVKLGSYPLAGTSTGVQRLQQGMGVGPRPMIGAPEPAIAAAGTSRTVTVTGAELVLANDAGYLVPAYEFTDSSGTAVGTVPAATDGSLETPTTVVVPKGVPASPGVSPPAAPKAAPATGGSSTAGGSPPIQPSPAVSNPCGPQPPPGLSVPNSCKG